MRHRFSPGLLAAVAVGGAAGTLLRLAAVQDLSSGGRVFPWGTLLVNLAGSLIVGFVAVTAFERLAPSRYFRPLIGTGFCGGLTTFSTFAVEITLLIRAGRVGMAVLYAVVSVVAGIGLARGGMLLAYALWNTEAN